MCIQKIALFKTIQIFSCAKTPEYSSGNGSVQQCAVNSLLPNVTDEAWFQLNSHKNIQNNRY
jgi:hypothetical protein